MKSIIVHLHFLTLLLCFSYAKRNFEDTPPCAGRNATSEPVIQFCLKQGGTLKYRCCVLNTDNIIVAVDFSNLNLTTVPDLSVFVNFNVSLIDLRMNPHLEYTSRDFISMKTLDSLYLPETYYCPGGDEVWEIVTKTNDTAGNLCQHQKDFCANRTDLCTQKQSSCQVNGPFHFLCGCETGYHGYKCLRKDSFPQAAFLAPTLSITVLVSAILYWTQRRHVKK